MRFVRRSSPSPIESGDVTVLLDIGDPAVDRVCEAVRTCRAANARLLLLCRVPRASCWIALAGMDPARMQAELVGEATAVLRRSLEHVPADLPTTTRLQFA